MRAELFVIEPGLWEASDLLEIRATCEGLLELGLYALPYDRVTVRIPARDIMRVYSEMHSIEEYDPEEIDKNGVPKSPFLCLEVTVSTTLFDPPKIFAYNSLSEFRMDLTDRIHRKADEDKNVNDRREALRLTVCDFLIAMLATRNTVKRTTVDKLAKLGIGKHKSKHRFTHTTTISLPRPEDIEDDHEHKPTGLHKAPHLRRGHIRHQHYGPKNTYIKRVWIAPVFVNADPYFVSAREGYNVTTRTERTDERTRQGA
jgi:hypothetical protein